MGSTRTRSGLAVAMTLLGLVLLIEVGLAGRIFNAQHLAGELAEIAVSKRADNGDIDRVIRSYRREHNLTSEQIRSERRARPFIGRHRGDLAGQ